MLHTFRPLLLAETNLFRYHFHAMLPCAQADDAFAGVLPGAREEPDPKRPEDVTASTGLDGDSWTPSSVHSGPDLRNLDDTVVEVRACAGHARSKLSGALFSLLIQFQSALALSAMRT